MSEKEFNQFNQCILLLPQVTEAIHVQLSMIPPFILHTEGPSPLDDFYDIGGSILIEAHGSSLHAWYLEACRLGPGPRDRKITMIDRRCICCRPVKGEGDGNDQA
jgi:hypothetical protein